MLKLKCYLLFVFIGMVPHAHASNAGAYPLGADDILLMRSTKVKEIDEKRFTVSKDGFLDVPMVGKLQAAGLQVIELQAAVEKSFERYYYNPRISVEIADHRSQPVSVLGSVTKPGIYQLQGRKTLADVLSMAGGLKPDAGYTVRISRASDAQSSEARERVFSYSVSEILKGGTGDDVLVSPHDVITVPRAELIYVIGDVRKAGGFALEEKENASVLQALALAEGALPTASLKACTILRPQVAGAERVSIPVNVKHLMSGKASDVMLQAGDVLIVPSSTIRKIGVKTAEAALQTASGIAIWRRP